jgi:hypothetical protein
MNRAVKLSECDSLSQTLVGGKAKNLGVILKNGFQIPDGYCLTTSFFDETKDNAGIQTFIEECIREMNRNKVITNKKLADIKKAILDMEFQSLPQYLQNKLNSIIEELLYNGKIAVRSSSPVEDGFRESHAGVYYSEINIESKEEVFRAIKRTWASLFTENAFFYQKGEIRKEMAVIIQQSIEPTISGVLFSKHPITEEEVPYVEFQRGTNLGITDGYGQSIQMGKLTEISSKEIEDHKLLFVETIKNLKNIFSSEIDIEWAIKEDKLIILQARPITTQAQKKPMFQWSCQENVNEIFGMSLGQLEDMFARQLQKKVWYRKFCIQQGVPIYGIYYLSYGEKDIERAMQLISTHITSKYFRIAWSKQGAVLCKLENVEEILKKCLLENVNSIGDGLICVQVSEVISADVSGFSSLTEKGNVVIEVYPAGIKGVKDGKNSPTEYCINQKKKVIKRNIRTFNQKGVLDEHTGTWHSNPITTKPYEISLSPENLDAVSCITRIMQGIGGSSIEWYISNNVTYLKDLSVENHIPEQTSDTMCLSLGQIVGTIVEFQEIEKLDSIAEANEISVVSYDLDKEGVFENNFMNDIRKRLNEVSSPILYAEYPSIGLIPLIPLVKGMVFKRGSLLCHTAIVLREHQIPSVITTMKNIKDGDNVFLHENGIKMLSENFGVHVDI